MATPQSPTRIRAQAAQGILDKFNMSNMEQGLAEARPYLYGAGTLVGATILDGVAEGMGWSYPEFVPEKLQIDWRLYGAGASIVTYLLLADTESEEYQNDVAAVGVGLVGSYLLSSEAPWGGPKAWGEMIGEKVSGWTSGWFNKAAPAAVATAPAAAAAAAPAAAVDAAAAGFDDESGALSSKEKKLRKLQNALARAEGRETKLKTKISTISDQGQAASAASTPARQAPRQLVMIAPPTQQMAMPQAQPHFRPFQQRHQAPHAR